MSKKADALAALKRTRAGEKRVLKEEDVQIYDEVDEAQYRRIVKGRLERDDFVVDDGAEGYVDNGMDDWDAGEQEFESEEEETRKKGKSSKKKKQPTAKSKVKPPPASAPSINAYRPVVSAEQEQDLMASILGNMDSIVSDALPAKASRKRKPSPTYDSDTEPVPKRSDYSSYRRKSAYNDASSDGIPEDHHHQQPSSDDGYSYSSPSKRVRVDDTNTALTPTTEGIAHLNVQSGSDDFDYDASFDDIDMDAFMQVDDEDVKTTKPLVKPEPVEVSLPKKSSVKKPVEVKMKAEEPDVKPAWFSVYDSLVVDTESSLGPLSSSALTSSSNPTNASILEDDGSLRFFWLDYLELDGKLYFTGKLKDKTSGTWLSCCVTVEGIERNLFVLPREKRVEMDEEGTMHETDVVPTQDDIDDDFELIRKSCNIKSYRGKFVKRKYAFGESDIPRGEGLWMKVVYGFHEPAIPANAISQNIGHILGTNTSAFELLVLKRKIMGPCWITIKDPQVEHKGVSWCKVEATVSNPKDFNPFSDTDPNAPKDIPPLNIMSLSLRTIVNHQENKREVVCATARVWHNMFIDDPAPPETLKCSVHTFIRPLDHFPPNFEKQAKMNTKGSIMPMKNERMLLSNLLMVIHKSDPDVIVGHDFLGVSLDVLLNRMRDLKADHWSRLGRFRRSKWPNIGKQGSNIKFVAGRMLCDLASDGAKSMIASTTWSMTEMCKTHLNIEREDFDPDDTASKLEGSVASPDAMLKFVRHCELDAHFQMAIASKVQILPLTRQLTNLAGNSWNKTLNGGRAERNEYILLHEFHRLKYICPDKSYGKKVKPEPVEEDETGAKKAGKGKRDKYKGGLVFEPKRGLWDKYILVMDFNSLYPSIIQEYNIDFTTVEPIDDDENGEEQIPEPPSSEVAQGVLPRLIATLVQRRRAVKSLMKDRSATPAQLLQYDIKQQALKLTANSMYGCLGFEYSRFYARPLAALTTYKGREILTHTRELAESLNLDVVYGDTDSVFVNSGVTDLAEALKISATFKKAVNDRYKLLEIDLDGIFQRLLLLQKKKYAAIKVDDGTRTSTEVKGLDMKRREYCKLSKDVSQYVLEQILSGEPTEVVVEAIHDYLTKIGEDVRNNRIKVDDFIINKRLGKNPEDYPDGKSQPHVQVALRMKQKGGSAKTGDVISYIFCLAEGEESSSKAAQADRARHPDELRKAGSAMTIDYQHYLSHQILPPIERLCDPIEGTDRSRLAECLGLDPMRYRTTVAGEEREFSGLDSQISDSERFRDSVPFLVRCRHCQGRFAFLPLNDPEANFLLPTGPTCPACSKAITSGSLQTQLEVQIREFIAKYYEGWTVCDDPTCDNRTRMMGVYGRMCLRNGCKGKIFFEYSDVQLYNQLRYFIYLLDSQKAITSCRKDQVGTFISLVYIVNIGSLTRLEIVTAIVTKNQVLLKTLTDCVEKHLNNCGRRWIDLAAIFSQMKLQS